MYSARGIAQTLCQAAGAAALLGAGAVYAAPAGPVLPGNADPGRLMEEYQRLPEPRLPAPEGVDQRQRLRPPASGPVMPPPVPAKPDPRQRRAREAGLPRGQ